jgi:hypothetical protein
MSEFIPAVGGSGSEYTVTEHTTGRVLTGEPEAVRARLVYALESLGYTVVSDNPIQARRKRQKNIFSADFTEYARRLAVGLRQVGAAATQVNFDFAVTHGGCATKGDRLTLEREADAIAALAAAPLATGLCPSCGTENGGDARFCRLCGAPNTSGVPAEVEVLRLTAGARAGLQEIVGGLFIALLTAAVTGLMMSVGKPKAFKAGVILLVIGEFFGWAMALYGLLRIYRTLRLKPEARKLAPAPDAAAASRLPHAQTSALPPAHFSVTEGTTELLGATAREAERVPLRRKEQGDTSPFA